MAKNIFMAASILLLTAASGVWTLFIIGLKYRSHSADTPEERYAFEERMWRLVRIGLLVFAPLLGVVVLAGFLI